MKPVTRSQTGNLKSSQKVRLEVTQEFSEDGQNLVRTERTCPYTINRQKALNKKASACDRPPLTLELKDNGKQTVIVCNTGTYEVTRQCIIQYYTSISSRHAIDEITDCYDQVRAKVGDKIKIVNRTKLGAGRLSKFTINQFHTTCRLHINGSAHSVFVEQDLPEIIKLLRRKLPAAAKLNERLRVLLESYNATKCDPGGKSPKLKIAPAKSTTSGTGHSSLTSKSPSSPVISNSADITSYACVHCTDLDNCDMIECTLCDS